MKKVLVLGGTQFLGRRMVERLQQQDGIELVLANRGKTNPELFAGIPRIQFNREQDDPRVLSAQDWDVVLDFSAYYPKSFAKLLECLKGRAQRYVFISTLSVFPFDSSAPTIINEDTPTVGCTEEESIDTTMMSYGARKAECERILCQADWLSGTSLRPSIIYGSYDWTERFYYWLYRVAQSRRFVLPGGGGDLCAFSELEDLCRMIEACMSMPSVYPLYNVTTHDPSTFSDYILQMQRALGTSSTAVAYSWRQLIEAEIHPGLHMPMCFGVPMNIDNTRILHDSGLRCRPLTEAFTELYAHFDSLNWPQPKPGLSLEKESGFLSR